MSLQKWGNSSHLPKRMLSCGHTLHGPVNQESVSHCSKTYQCPQCGALFPKSSHHGKAWLADYCPDRNYEWHGCPLLQVCQLSDKSIAEGKLWTFFEHLLARLEHLCGTVDLKGRTARPEKPQRRPATGRDEGHLFAWRSDARGWRLTNGRVFLMPRDVWLLTGRGAGFAGITFTGGMIVCCGEHFSGSFRHCHFIGCRVYVAHGAAVTLHRCKVAVGIASVTGPGDTGIVASGPGTRVAVTSCSFHSLTAALTAEAGATLQATFSSFHVSYVAAVVNGTGSHLSLNGCESRGVKSGFHAVNVTGGSARVHDCLLRGYLHTLHAVGPDSSIEVTRSSFSHFQLAISCEGGARIFCRELDVGLPHPQAPGGDGLPLAIQIGPVDGEVAEGADSSPQARLEDSEEAAGGVVAMVRCTVKDTTRSVTGVHITDGGRAALTLCDVEAREAGVRVEGPLSHLTARHCACAASIAVAILDNAGVRAHACTFSGDLAACTVLRGAALVATGTRFCAEHCDSLGVTLHDRATARLTACVLAARDVDLLAEEGSSLWLQACTLRVRPRPDEQAGVGVKLVLCTAEIAGCTFEVLPDPNPGGPARPSHSLQKGIYLVDPVQLEVNSCHFSGCGVRGSAGAELVVHSCSFVAGGAAACDDVAYVVLYAPDDEAITTSALVDRCTFASSHTCVVVAGGDSAVIRECHFQGDVQHAVLVDDEAGAGTVVLVDGCSFQGCEFAVRVNQCKRLELCNSQCTDVGAALMVGSSCDGADIRLWQVEIAARLIGVVALSKGRVTLDVVDCTIEAMQACIAASHPSTHVEMHGCALFEARTGVDLTRGASATIRSSSFERCVMAVCAGHDKFADSVYNIMLAHASPHQGPRQGAAGQGGSAAAPSAAELSHLILEDVCVSDAFVGVLVCARGHADVVGMTVDVTGSTPEGSTACADLNPAYPSTFQGCTARYTSGCSAPSIVRRHSVAPARGTADAASEPSFDYVRVPGWTVQEVPAEHV